jgi:hypothetical protein
MAGQQRTTDPTWEKRSEEIQAEYHDIEAHLTSELCRLSLHLRNLVERRLVLEGSGQEVPDSEEAFRLGERMMRVGSLLMVDSRK